MESNDVSPYLQQWLPLQFVVLRTSAEVRFQTGDACRRDEWSTTCLKYIFTSYVICGNIMKQTKINTYHVLDAS
jgi:hypothetical protein